MTAKYACCRECAEQMIGIMHNDARHTCHTCCNGGDGGQIIRDKHEMRDLYGRYGVPTKGTSCAA